MSRKLDAALAEALGYEVLWVDGEPRRKHKQVSTWPSLTVPRYSTNGNAMLELDREMRARGWWISLAKGYGGIFAVYWRDAKGTLRTGGCSDSIPHTVALAAYHALTGKEWVEQGKPQNQKDVNERGEKQ